MARLTAPTLPPGPRKRLSDELHSVHRRAGWPSVRELARALGTGVVSSSRIHDAFTKPRLPTWGLVQVLVVELANRTPGADAAAEVRRLHTLWDEAAQVDAPPLAGDEPRPGQVVALPRVPAAGVGRPAPRTMLIADQEGFSRRPDVDQAYMRRTLYGLLDRVAAAAGVGPEARRQADRGDSVMELIEAAVPVADLLRALLTVLPADLNAFNRLVSDAARIRLRLVLATGSVTVDEHDGWVGAALNDACRLVDSQALRLALRERKGDYALCVSQSVYWGTVHQNHDGVPAAEFNEVAIHTKNGVQQAWLHQPLSA